MKKIYFLFLVLQLGLNGQNWNPFNYAYRYNYSYNNSTIVSHILFADSFDVNGQDTLLFLNRIALPCNGSCLTTTVTEPSGKYYFVSNIPQMMQRKLLKKSNCWIQFLDTASLNISSQFTLNQTWLADTSENVNAQFVSLSTRNVFGAIDSVRVYILGNSDSIVLSKNHGILVFPQPYNFNKYYRLKGIERNHVYDSVSVKGTKVPNAWDIYRFEPGDVICREQFGHDRTVLSPINYKDFEQLTITGRTITANSYLYSLDRFQRWQKAPEFSLFFMEYYTNWDTYTISINNLTNETRIENAIYPGALVQGSVPIILRNFSPGVIGRSIGSFGVDNAGRFYKTTGAATITAYTIPASTDKSCGLDVAGTNGVVMERALQGSSYVYFMPTFGLMSSGRSQEIFSSEMHLECFERNGVSIFGPKIIGINETADARRPRLFPNPASSLLYCEGVDSAIAIIYDLLGKQIAHKLFAANGTCDVSDISAGTYLISIHTQQGPVLRSKLLITR